IAAHLAAGCDACQREMAVWQQVVELVPLGLEEESASAPDLKPRLLRRVRGPSDAVPRRARVLRAAGPLAVAAASLIAPSLGRELQWRDQLAAQRRAEAQLQQRLTEAGDRLAEVSRVLTERERDVTALRAALKTAHDTLGLLQSRSLQLVRLSQTPDARPA